jgi:hypothetical protein
LVGLEFVNGHLLLTEGDESGCDNDPVLTSGEHKRKYRFTEGGDSKENKLKCEKTEKCK